MITIRKARETAIRYKGAILRLSYERRHDLVALLIGCPICGLIFAAYILLMVRG